MMQSAPASFFTKNRFIIQFVVLAYCISAIISVIIVAGDGLDRRIHYLNAFAPLVAAGLVVLQEQGIRGIKILAQKLLPRQISWRIIVVIVSPFLLLAVALMISKLVFGEHPNLSQIGQINYFGDLGIGGAWLLWVLTFGLGEEVGWRGYLLPKLVDQFGFRQATVILGLIWSCWHIPQFWYLGNIGSSPLGFVMFTASIICGSLVLGAIYYATDQLLWPVVIWHGTFNWITASQGLTPNIPMIASLLVILASIVIWQKYPTITSQR